MTSSSQPTSKADLDLWKFFEDRCSKLKESLFNTVSWVLGFSAAVLGFAVKEGYASCSSKVGNPILMAIMALAGLLLLMHAYYIVRDYVDHINRTFNRADAARMGEIDPQKVWAAGNVESKGDVPAACRDMFRIIGLFAIAFLALLALAISTLLAP